MSQNNQQPKNKSSNQNQKPKLSRKQAVFVDEYVKTGNGTEAALKAYEIESKNPENVAAVIATENLRKPNVVTAIEITQATLKSALIEKGVTPKKIATKINKLLDAQTPIYKNNNATKQIELVGYSDDFTAIDKGLKHATAIFGVADPEQPKSMNMYNFFFKPELRKEVEDIETKIKSALLQDAQKD